jgi:hypothetical protein
LEVSNWQLGNALIWIQDESQLAEELAIGNWQLGNALISIQDESAVGRRVGN